MKADFPIIQGPLAGVSSAPFRRLAHIYGAPDFCCTEMISAKHLVNHFKDQHRFIVKSPEEGKLCYQISGNDPDILARATERLNTLKADYIDLNCGCPKPKIRKKGTGSKMLENPALLATCLNAIKHNANCPVSVKIRIDGDSGDNYTQAVIDAAHQANLDFIVIHARHWLEDYTSGLHTEKLSEYVRYSDLPIIGNGDVADAPSLQNMINTGCAGVMVSRAGVGQPWLFQQLHASLTNRHFDAPTTDLKKHIMLEHIEGLIALDGEFRACMAARKLGKYYNRAQDFGADFNEQIKHVSTLNDIKTLLTL